MENKLKKKYGLLTAICMVVGIVIGSGVFVKGSDVLEDTGGSVSLGILAWVIGGIVMMICAYNFATFANKYEKVNGVVDYAEAIVGPKYAYIMGWFVSIIYFPAMTGVLAWVSARYTLAIFVPDGPNNFMSGLCIALGAFYLCAVFAMNVLAPKISGKFQISATVVKLIPVIIMAVVGTIIGIINRSNGNIVNDSVVIGDVGFDSIFGAIVTCAFAYEGWIVATSINSELRDSKKNLPIALIVGCAIVMIIYVTYFIGLTSSSPISELLKDGAGKAFYNLFNQNAVVGTIFNVFVAVSCLGTLNGLVIACTRSAYSVAVRNQGPKPEVFKEVSNNTNMPNNSSILSLLMCGFWFFYFVAGNLVDRSVYGVDGIFGVFNFDSSELPIITVYALYIPIFIMFIVKEGKKNIFKNIVMPLLGVIASLFMVFSAAYSHGYVKYQQGLEDGVFQIPALFYLIVFVVVMVIGILFYKKKSNNDIF